MVSSKGVQFAREQAAIEKRVEMGERILSSESNDMPKHAEEGGVIKQKIEPIEEQPAGENRLDDNAVEAKAVRQEAKQGAITPNTQQPGSSGDQGSDD